MQGRIWRTQDSVLGTHYFALHQGVHQIKFIAANMHKFGIEMISSLSLTRCCKNIMTLFYPPNKFFLVRRAVCQNTTRLVNPLVAQSCNAHCENRALKNLQFRNFCHLRHCSRSLSVFDIRPASISLSIGSDWIALSI